MKNSHNLAFLCVAAAMVSAAFSAEPVKVVGEYLPEGALANGTIIRVEFDRDLNDYLRKFDEAASKLSKEDQEELRQMIKPGQPIPYDARFGISKEEYDKYIEVWNKKKIVDLAPVVVGFQPDTEKGVYKVASSTQQGPLPFSTLKYDSNKGVWISPNGVLERKDDVTYNSLNNLGAWKGQEWLFESKTTFSHMAENILMGKTDDGKFVYVIYNFLELTTQGTLVDNKTVVLRFPVQNIKADPLQGRRGSGHSL